MKFKNILAAAAAVAALAVGCTQELPGDLAELQVDNAYASIPAEGGSATINVTSTTSWAFEALDDKTAAWLTVEPMQGSAGNTAVSFKADATESTRSAELKITVAGKTQYINVKQACAAADGTSLTTCAEVLAAPDGKTFRIKGIVSAIEASVYGNYNVTDETGTVYVYGTLDKSGAEKNFASLGIENGDEVTVEGPKSTYNGKVELVNVTVIEIVKSLVKVESVESENVAKEGGETLVKVLSKGDHLDIKPLADWIKIGSLGSDKDTTMVTLSFAANEGDVRTGDVEFSSSVNGQTSAITVTFTQASGLACYQLPFEESFADNLGAFEINDIDVEKTKSGVVWAYASGYGAKASSGQKCVSESDLVSPLIDLTSVSSATLSFEHTSKYAGDLNEQLTLWVSKDNGETWTQLLIPVYPTNADWNFVESGAISLNAFVGNQVKIAFKYRSNDDFYPTWEVKNVKVVEGNGEITTVAQINNMASSSESDFTATLTDAVVTYVNGNNVFIEDATAGIQLYMKDHGFVAGQKISGQVNGKVKLYNGYAELTAIDVAGATVADGDVPEGTTVALATLLKDYLRYQNCKVVLENATLSADLSSSSRNGTVSQDGSEINAYLQDKTQTVAAGTGKLVCFPTRYNATLQVGIWAPEHFTTE